MCRFNKGVRLSKKQKWAEEIILNLVDLFNSRSKDGTKRGTKRQDDGTKKQTDQDRDNSSASNRTDKSVISKEHGG
jgi:hypothetical protein